MKETRLRSVALVLGLAALVAMAGCSSLSGLGGGGDGGAAGNGYGVAAGDLDGETVDNASATVVESAGSYTLTTDVTSNSTRNDRAVQTAGTTTTRVDLDDERGIREQESTTTVGSQSRNTTVVVYTNETDTYGKQGTGEDATYGTASSGLPIRPVTVSGFDQNFASIVDGIEWSDGTEATVDGVAVTRYEASGVANASALLGPGASAEDVSGSIAIDGDGLVREFSLTLSFSSNDVTTTTDVTVRITDVGSTTVEEPDWLAQAQS